MAIVPIIISIEQTTEAILHGTGGFKQAAVLP